MWMRSMGHGFPGYGGFSFYHMLICIGVLLLIIGVVIYISKNKRNDSILELLKSEYAKGNITEEAYERKKNILKGD